MLMSAAKLPYAKKRAFQFIGVFWAIAALCFFTIATGSQTPPPQLSTPFNLFVVLFGVAIILPLMVLFDSYVKRIRLLFYLTMYLFAGLLMLFYIGTYHPLVALWLALATMTYIEFGKMSYYYSTFALLGTNGLFFIFLSMIVDREFELAEYIFYSLAYSTVLIATGYILTKIIDNSERRRQEIEVIRKSEAAQLNKVSALLNSITDAILTLDERSCVTSQNAAALALFDTNESLIGKKITDILNIQDVDKKKINVTKLIASITRSQSRDDIVIPSDDHESVRVSMQMAPIYADNKRQGVILVIRDITKQKTLEDEKDEFISVASHELRTPIAVTEASLSNLVLMQEKGMPAEKLAAAATLAHDEVVYLAGVVNDLSTLSRAERGVADSTEPVDVDELFHELYAKYEPSATKKDLKLNLDIKGKLPIVEVSRLYLEEMIQNFLTNAIKYTKEGSVTLSAEAVKGGVRCSVIDTGIGISKADQKHLGERFFRSEDYRTRETNGTGLGLYVVEKLADKIGTKIEVESRLNHGSTFSIVVQEKSKSRSTGKRSTYPLPES